MSLCWVSGVLSTVFCVSGTANPSAQTVEFQMYALLDDAGNPTNYIKVRDLALAMNGTKGRFNVGWSEERGVFIESDKPYTDAD